MSCCEIAAAAAELALLYAGSVFHSLSRTFFVLEPLTMSTRWFMVKFLWLCRVLAASRLTACTKETHQEVRFTLTALSLLQLSQAVIGERRHNWGSKTSPKYSSCWARLQSAVFSQYRTMLSRLS